MPEVNGRTLVMAVQAVDAQVRTLSRQIDAASEDDDVTDLEDLLLSYMNTAAELRTAYEAALKLTSNLPPYAKLVGASDSSGDG